MEGRRTDGVADDELLADHRMWDSDGTDVAVCVSLFSVLPIFLRRRHLFDAEKHGRARTSPDTMAAIWQLADHGSERDVSRRRPVS